MPDVPAYSLVDALGYFDTLLPNELELSVTAVDLVGERIQPTIGKQVAALLDVLIRATKPSNILEIGTSCGYSACVLGTAAKSYGGHVITFEINARLADAARKNARALGLEGVVEVQTGDASIAVRELHKTFGLILQDGHKEQYVPMLRDLIRLLEPSGLLISDDVLFPVMQLPASVENWKRAMNDYNPALRDHPDLRTSWLPIGDGVAISAKL